MIVQTKTVAKTAGWLAVATIAVAGFESLRLNSYPDIVGTPTICYGETKNVKLGQKATKEECDAKLAARLVEFNNGVNSCVTWNLRDNERAASVSLAYNIGVDAFCKSTVVSRFNAGDKAGACDAFLMWNKAGGKVVQGLVNRRQKEREMCLKDY